MNLMIEILVFVVLLAIFFGVPILAVAELRRPHRFKGRHCQHCNFDRRKLPPDAKCPECGNPPAILGMGRPVDDTFPSCRRCGHLLENLPWDTDCPECGLACAAMPKFERLPKGHFITPKGLVQFIVGGIWGLSSLYLVLVLASLLG